MIGTFATVSEIVRDNAHWVALFTFCAGLLIGNWLAIGRDRRKEFNEVSEPIRHSLLMQISRIDKGDFVYQQTVERSDFVCLGMFIGERRKVAYELAVKEYFDSFTKSGHRTNSGSWEIDDLSVCRTAAVKLLSFAVIK